MPILPLTAAATNRKRSKRRFWLNWLIYETVNSFGFQAIKDGSWFAKFIQSCLSSYDQRVMQQGGAAYLRAEYPGLPTDAIAGKLCELAETYAAVASGVSGAAASAAVLTAGMAIPAAISGVMAEVLYTVRLQLRLAYDLHLVYGVPLDANDPEELTRLFGVVYGVKAAELGGLGIKAYGPEVARAQLFRLIHGNTPMIQAAASQVLGPRIAKQITQKAMIKTAVPIVGTAISAGWNYTTTRMMATRVRHGVRVSAALREETQRLQGQIGRNEQAEVAVLEGLMASPSIRSSEACDAQACSRVLRADPVERLQQRGQQQLLRRHRLSAF
jgi:uncharacterized protein (DUF697 family)